MGSCACGWTAGPSYQSARNLSTCTSDCWNRTPQARKRSALGLELQGCRIDAVALASSVARPVIEEVPEVRPAIPTNYLSADHPIAEVWLRLNVLADIWPVEA